MYYKSTITKSNNIHFFYLLNITFIFYQDQISAIGLLCLIKPDLFIKPFLRHAYQRLETDRYLLVDKRSYEIMKTPFGQLYDKNVMET